MLPYSSGFSQITDDKGLPNLLCFMLLGELVLCSFLFLSQHYSKLWGPGSEG